MPRRSLPPRVVYLAVPLLGLLALAFLFDGRAQVARPNVLFIAVDDLRPQLGAYGVGHVVSPNIDRLAATGMRFDRAYCQVPVCGASRASLLTGLRPARDRFVDYATWAQEDAPGVTSLPQHFRAHGYYTVANGKVFHHVDDVPESWSEPAWRPEGNGRDYRMPDNQRIAARRDGLGPPFEVGDVPEEAYYDGQVAMKSLADLRWLAQKDEPFFLAVGFFKPHLPFNAPRAYWDLYERDALPLVEDPRPPADAPAQALHRWGELRQYAGIPPSGPLSDDLARTLVHGYHAALSYTDALVGRLLDELDRLGLADETIVVLWGDHGWNLREHGLWCKHCNFETSLRAPLLLRAPGMTGGRATDALTEFVDVYPSLCELAGLPVPDHVEGTSFVPLLRDPDRPWKTAAFSRWHAGESVRTDRYLYTEWTDDEGTVTARMLYDHAVDPGETVNLAGRPEHRVDVDRLSRMLRAGWRAAGPPGVNVGDERP